MRWGQIQNALLFGDFELVVRVEHDLTSCKPCVAGWGIWNDGFVVY
jgi:hypothetical protein